MNTERQRSLYAGTGEFQALDAQERKLDKVRMLECILANASLLRPYVIEVEFDAESELYRPHVMQEALFEEFQSRSQASSKFSGDFISGR